MEQFADPDYLTGQMLAALANHRRRIFIRYIDDNTPVELKQVAIVISEIEHTSKQSAYTSLYQTHTDKLCAAQIIEQQNGQKTFVKGEHYETAKQILDYCDSL